MTVSTEVTLALIGLIVTLAGAVAFLAHALRGMASDARDANKLTMSNANEFTRLIAEARREADAHQAQRAEWELEGRALRDKMDSVLDRIRELERGCEEYEAQIRQLQARISALTAAVDERDERIAELNERIGKLENENGRLTREEERWQADRRAWERERKALLAERDELRAEQSTLAQKVAELQQKVARLEKGTGPLEDPSQSTSPGGAEESTP